VAAEQNGACAAYTDEPAMRDLKQMKMIGSHFQTAHFALFRWSRPPSELAQDVKGLALTSNVSRIDHRIHCTSL